MLEPGFISAVVATSDLTVGVVVALVGGVSGVAGALVGGVLTGRVALQAERDRQVFTATQADLDRRRQDDERAARIRGAARVLRSSLRGAEIAISAVVDVGGWDADSATSLMTLALREEDRQALLAALTSDDSQRVELAEMSIANYESRRTIRRLQAELQPEAAAPVFGEGDREFVIVVLQEIRLGIEALELCAAAADPAPPSEGGLVP